MVSIAVYDGATGMRGSTSRLMTAAPNVASTPFSLLCFFVCRPDALSSRSRPRARFPKASAGNTTRRSGRKRLIRSICSHLSPTLRRSIVA